MAIVTENEKKYAVFFSQVNQERIDVFANDPQEAMEKATEIWKGWYGKGVIKSVEEIES